MVAVVRVDKRVSKFRGLRITSSFLFHRSISWGGLPETSSNYCDSQGFIRSFRFRFGSAVRGVWIIPKHPVKPIIRRLLLGVRHDRFRHGTRRTARAQPSVMLGREILLQVHVQGRRFPGFRCSAGTVDFRQGSFRSNSRSGQHSSRRKTLRPCCMALLKRTARLHHREQKEIVHSVVFHEVVGPY